MAGPSVVCTTVTDGLADAWSAERWEGARAASASSYTIATHCVPVIKMCTLHNHILANVCTASAQRNSPAFGVLHLCGARANAGFGPTRKSSEPRRPTRFRTQSINAACVFSGIFVVSKKRPPSIDGRGIERRPCPKLRIPLHAGNGRCGGVGLGLGGRIIFSSKRRRASKRSAFIPCRAKNSTTVAYLRARVDPPASGPNTQRPLALPVNPFPARRIETRDDGIAFCSRRMKNETNGAVVSRVGSRILSLRSKLKPTTAWKHDLGGGFRRNNNHSHGLTVHNS